METNESKPVEPPDTSQSQPATAKRNKNKLSNAGSGSALPPGCVVALVEMFIVLPLAAVLIGLSYSRSVPATEQLANWQAVTLLVLLSCGVLPFVLWKKCREHSTFRLAVATGGFLGLVYGLVNGRLLPTAFFGACIGAFSGYILYLRGMPRCDGWQLTDPPYGARSAAKRTAAATTLAYAGFYLLGFVTPTPVVPKDQARWFKGFETQLAQDAANREKEAREAAATKDAAAAKNAAAANPKGKLTAFKAVVAQFKQFPDRFTPDSQRTAYNEELGKLVREFTEYPFDAKANPSIGRSIVELFEGKIEGNYTGYHFNCVDECVRNIYVESLNR